MLRVWLLLHRALSLGYNPITLNITYKYNRICLLLSSFKRLPKNIIFWYYSPYRRVLERRVGPNDWDNCEEVEEKYMQEKLMNWLDQNMPSRGFTSDRQLAIAADLATSAISKVRRGVQPLGWKACAKIADAMSVSRQLILTLAGHLENQDEWDSETTFIVNEFLDLDDRDQQEIMALIRFKKQQAN